MKQRPSISYIIPAYKYATLLTGAVESICDGNLTPGDEIIIVNDASPDDTAAVAAALAAKNSQITILTHRHNKGCCSAGVNTAAEAAANDHFFILAADNLLAPNTVNALAAFMMEKNADVAAFQEVRFFIESTSKPTHSWFFNEETFLADAFATYVWPGSDGNYLFTRDSWLKSGRCDEFFGGLDSWAFGIQQLVTGSKMVALPGGFYHHRYGHDSLWMREAGTGKLSIKALRVILPILDLFEQETVEYLFSPEGRTSWFEKLPERPLRLRGKEVGGAGRIEQAPRRKDPLLKRVRRQIAHRIAPK